MPAHRQPGGTAFALRDPLPWSDFSGLARAGERLGYSGVFLPEIAGRDAFAALAALAGETSGLLLATGIVPMPSRTPLLTAMSAATVQERSAGRHILGIGTGPAAPGALERLRDHVATVRAFLAGEAEGLALDPGRRPPIWISALGVRSVRLAGEIADGVILNWCTPDRVAQARADVRVAAETAGRDPDAVTIAAYVRANLDPEDSAAVALRRAASEYAGFPSYARQFVAMGLRGEAEAAASGEPEAADALVRAVCVTVRDGPSRLTDYAGAGADMPIVYPVPSGPDPAGSIERTLRALAPSRL